MAGSQGRQFEHPHPFLLPLSPGGADQRLHLFHEVTANHVLVAGDSQRVRHGFSVESGVEDHDGAVHATIQEVFGKLLQGERKLKGDFYNPVVWPGQTCKSI